MNINKKINFQKAIISLNISDFGTNISKILKTIGLIIVLTCLH